MVNSHGCEKSITLSEMLSRGVINLHQYTTMNTIVAGVLLPVVLLPVTGCDSKLTPNSDAGTI